MKNRIGWRWFVNENRGYIVSIAVHIELSLVIKNQSVLSNEDLAHYVIINQRFILMDKLRES